MNHHWLKILNIIHAGHQSNQEQAPIQGGASEKPQDPSLLPSRHVPGADGCGNTEDLDDSDDWKDW
jgi:hypothetical protein